MSEDVVGLVFLLFSLAFLPAIGIFMTRQAADGAIGRNGSSGIRTRHTQASDAAWVAGHRAALPVMTRMWTVAVVGAVVAVGAQLVAGEPAGILLGLGALLVQVLVLARAASAANRAAQAVTGD